MKDLKETKELIAEHRSELSDIYGIIRIGVFGSYLRGEQDDASDVDILVEFIEPIGLEVVDLVEQLERILDTRVDLVTPKGLRPALRTKVLSEVSYV